MRCAKCAYCVHSNVEEELQEDAMGFEYVEKTLNCELEYEPENCYECSQFKGISAEDLNEVDDV